MLNVTMEFQNASSIESGTFNATQEALALQLLVTTVLQLAGNLTRLEKATKALHGSLQNTNLTLDGTATLLQQLFGAKLWKNVENFVVFFTSTDFKVILDLIWQ